MPDTIEGLTDRERRLLNAAISAAVKARTNRALVWGLIAGAALMAAIAIPVTYVLTSEAQNSRYDALQQRLVTQRETSRRNCRLVQKLARVQKQELKEQAAESARFVRESKDTLGLSPEAFRALIKRGHEREQRKVRAVNAVASVSCLPVA